MAKKESNYYYETFTKCAGYACEAAVLLQSCIRNYDPKNAKMYQDKVHSIEHTADGVRHELMERLMKEFLPPIEREDIVELSRAIDGVVDSIEDVLQGLYMYNVMAFRPEVKELGEVIFRSCQAMKDMVAELHRFHKSTLMREKIIEINALEEEADRLFNEALHRLYTEEKEPIYFISWNTM
ncbi:MAG: DUF47 family protein, partial [Bacillota bacterium]|nr:DUF47 family protein [Bacillota bacterium]